MRLVVAFVIVFLVAGCSAGAGTEQQPFAADPTDLAVESPVDAITQSPEKTSKPKPTKKPDYYTPKGWDGYSDVDCKDFKTRKQAVSFFKGTGGSKTNDPFGLDSEHDGKPCETLP